MYAAQTTHMIANVSAPLTDAQIMRSAPSVFADAAHESRSSRYAYIPTCDVLGALRKEGFQPFSAQQSQSRREGHKNHTKHMIRLRHADTIGQLAKVGGDVNEIILINSHNGTSSYQMMAGCFRFVCSNGMVCGNIVEDVRIHHKGDVRAQVVEGAYKVLGNFQAVNDSKENFKTHVLTAGEQTAYARAAIALRFNVEDPSTAPVSTEQVLRANRYEDQGSSLWDTFQRVQENTVRGGLRTHNPQTRRRGHTREVGGIDGNVALNRALWVLAEELRKAR